MKTTKTVKRTIILDGAAEEVTVKVYPYYKATFDYPAEGGDIEVFDSFGDLIEDQEIYNQVRDQENFNVDVGI